MDEDILKACEEVGIDILSCKKCSHEQQDHVPFYMLFYDMKYVFICASCFKKGREFHDTDRFKPYPEMPSENWDRRRTQ